MLTVTVQAMLIVLDLLHLPRSAGTAPEPVSAAQPGRTSPCLRRPSSKHVPHTLWSAPLFPSHAFLFFRSLRAWSARCAWVREALRWPGGCTCSRCSAGAPCKSRRQRAGWRCERLFQLANCQGELRPIFSGERRRGLALHSGAARTRPTPALQNHLEAP